MTLPATLLNHASDGDLTTVHVTAVIFQIPELLKDFALFTILFEKGTRKFRLRKLASAVSNWEQTFNTFFSHV